MKKIALTAALIISVMLAVSCAATPNPVVIPEPPSPKDVDEQYESLYDASIGLDLTGAVTYTVKRGDTLSNISRRFYNKDGFYYPIIMLASRGVVVNPDKIRPGMVLTIPDLERNKADVKCRKTIKDCLNGFADIERTKRRPRRGLINGFRKRADELS